MSDGRGPRWRSRYSARFEAGGIRFGLSGKSSTITVSRSPREQKALLATSFLTSLTPVGANLHSVVIPKPVGTLAWARDSKPLIISTSADGGHRRLYFPHHSRQMLQTSCQGVKALFPESRYHLRNQVWGIAFLASAPPQNCNITASLVSEPSVTATLQVELTDK